MSTVGCGVIAYRKVGPQAAARSVALLMGAAGFAGAAHAAEEAAPVAAGAAVVAGVDVTAPRRALDRRTGLSVLPSTVQDTPQAISVIGNVQLKAQGVTSLEQALRNVPGITIAIGEGGTLSGDQFKIRGFDAKDDVYIDGLRDFGAYTRDSFNYEEVQVLKGPSGAMFGRGTTGGAINTISKRPKLSDFANVDGYVGNGDYRRGLADINHQLGATTAARLTLMANDTGVVDRDHIYAKRWGGAVTLATGIGTDTTAGVSYLHQHNKSRPDYGIIIVQKPGDLITRPASDYGVGVERSTFTGYLADVDRGDADIVTVRLSRVVNDKLTLNSDTRYGVYSRYFQYSTLDQCNAACTTALFDGNPATEAFGGNGGQGPYDMDAWGLQNITTARIDYNVGRLKNQLIVGLDVSRQQNDRTIFAYTLPPGVATRPAIPRPLVDPNPNFPAGYAVFRAVPGQNISCVGSTLNCTTLVNGVSVATNTLGTATERSKGASTDAGLFLTDRLWLNDQVSVIGSYRIDRYTATLDSRLFNNSQTSIKVKPTLKSPRLSAVYEPAHDQTYYLSWGRSQTPQGTSIVGSGAALAVTTRDLAPETSQIWEAGAKVGLPGTRLALTASIFQVKKGNALQTDPATGFLQAQSGERQRVKGIELGLTGAITPAWTLSAGYTRLDAKIEDSYTNCSVAAANVTGTPTGLICPVGGAVLPVRNTIAVGRQVTFVPKTSASLFTTYDASDWLQGLSAGGDLTYQSKTPLAYAARSVSYADRASQTTLRLAEAPKAITLNAFAAYRTGPYRVAVNLYNLTNRLNYTQLFSNRAIPAAGRTVIFSVGAGF